MLALYRHYSYNTFFSTHTIIVEGDRRQYCSARSFRSPVRPFSSRSGPLVRPLGVRSGSLVRPLAGRSGSLVRPRGSRSGSPVLLVVAVVDVGWSIVHLASG